MPAKKKQSTGKKKKKLSPAQKEALRKGREKRMRNLKKKK